MLLLLLLLLLPAWWDRDRDTIAGRGGASCSAAKDWSSSLSSSISSEAMLSPSVSYPGKAWVEHILLALSPSTMGARVPYPNSSRLSVRREEDVLFRWVTGAGGSSSSWSKSRGNKGCCVELVGDLDNSLCRKVALFFLLVVVLLAKDDDFSRSRVILWGMASSWCSLACRRVWGSMDKSCSEECPPCSDVERDRRLGLLLVLFLERRVVVGLEERVEPCAYED